MRCGIVEPLVKDHPDEETTPIETTSFETLPSYFHVGKSITKDHPSFETTSAFCFRVAIKVIPLRCLHFVPLSTIAAAQSQNNHYGYRWKGVIL